MRLATVAVATTTALSAFCANVPAQSLIVHARLAPALATGEVDTTLAPQVNSEHVVLIPIAHLSYGYRYSMKENTRLLGAVQVSYAQPPQGYIARNLEVRVPYYSATPLQVSLYAVRPPASVDENRRIREIFGTGIGKKNGELRHNELFRLYQEVAIISSNRISRIRKQNDFNYLDAKIFFKFMEIAVYLGRHASLVMGGDVLTVRDFVRSQMQETSGKQVVLKGTSQTLRSIEDILRFVDFVDADHLRKLWALVKKRTNGRFTEEACMQYLEFFTTVTGGDYDLGLVGAYDLDEDYRIVTLAAEALEVCANGLNVRPADGGVREQANAMAEAAGNLDAIDVTKRATTSLHNIKQMLMQ